MPEDEIKDILQGAVQELDGQRFAGGNIPTRCGYGQLAAQLVGDCGKCLPGGDIARRDRAEDAAGRVFKADAHPVFRGLCQAQQGADHK